jgi:DNA repair protein RAD57
MALALSAQLPSCTPFPGGSIILTSERELPTDRLIQLAKSMLASQKPQKHQTPIPTPTVKRLLDNIHTNKCTDVDALDHALSYSLPWVLEKNRLAGTDIRLIVLDSITALFRGGETTFSSTSAGLAHRSRLLCSIADKLKALAVEYDIAVVVINLRLIRKLQDRLKWRHRKLSRLMSSARNSIPIQDPSRPCSTRHRPGGFRGKVRDIEKKRVWG